MESGLFRAPAHPYAPPHSDFLLLRSPVSLKPCRVAHGRRFETYHKGQGCWIGMQVGRLPAAALAGGLELSFGVFGVLQYAAAGCMAQSGYRVIRSMVPYLASCTTLLVAVPPKSVHSSCYFLHSCVYVQAGTMQLRELAGTVTVGQELPMLRVPAPNAREVK